MIPVKSHHYSTVSRKTISPPQLKWAISKTFIGHALQNYFSVCSLWRILEFLSVLPFHSNVWTRCPNKDYLSHDGECNPVASVTNTLPEHLVTLISETRNKGQNNFVQHAKHQLNKYLLTPESKLYYPEPGTNAEIILQGMTSQPPTPFSHTLQRIFHLITTFIH